MKYCWKVTREVRIRHRKHVIQRPIGLLCSLLGRTSHLQLMLRRAMSAKWKPRYFDIGVNFSDSMFQGCYNGSKTPKHPADVSNVVARAQLFNVDKMLITASSIEESKEHFDLVEQYNGSFGSTVGVHPCTVAQEFYGSLEDEHLLPTVEEKLDTLRKIAEEGAAKGLVKAFGEIGLDYDRLHYSSVAQQREMFRKQLEVQASLAHLNLPLFLHMRAACDDFVEIIESFYEKGLKRGHGVVHSFTGDEVELKKILDLGFMVGINGCSLKTEENLKVAKLIPKDRLLIETDAPWCEIRKSHASYKYITTYPNIFYPQVASPGTPEAEEQNGKKKQPQPKAQQIKLDDILPFPSIKKENFEKHGALVQKKLEDLGEAPATSVGEFAYPLIKSRNEPVFVGYVAEIMASLYGLHSEDEIREFIDQVYENSCKLFNM